VDPGLDLHGDESPLLDSTWEIPLSLRDRLAVLTAAVGVLAAAVAAAAQDGKADRGPGGLVERVVGAYVGTETATAERTRRRLDPLADALARVRDQEELDRDGQVLPAAHPLTVAGRARPICLVES
jgi:hypothetical protein